MMALMVFHSVLTIDNNTLSVLVHILTLIMFIIVRHVVLSQGIALASHPYQDGKGVDDHDGK